MIRRNWRIMVDPVCFAALMAAALYLEAPRPLVAIYGFAIGTHMPRWIERAAKEWT